MTMAFHSEAVIAREIHKFVANGLLYRGVKPVMWSVVRRQLWLRPRSNIKNINQSPSG